LEERPDATDLTRAIWDDPTLSEAQKRALVQVYRSFQAENRADADAGDAPAGARSGPNGERTDPGDPLAAAAAAGAGREHGPAPKR
jgi:hypothetical protein